jgi:curved DNA-binding protein CbpA
MRETTWACKDNPINNIPMFWFEAMAVLGLTLLEIKDISVIRNVWKKLVVQVHPDKLNRKDATSQTQRLNEARDVLIARLQQPRQDSGDNHWTEKRETEAQEAKKQAEEEARAERYREYDKHYERAKEIRRERHAKNRRKRAPEARVHKKIENYKEGKELVDEMKAFFRENFVSNQWNKLLVSDVLSLFIKSRDSTSNLEINLFKRHSKKLFKCEWPGAISSTLRNKRCFLHVGPRE